MGTHQKESFTNKDRVLRQTNNFSSHCVSKCRCNNVKWSGERKREKWGENDVTISKFAYKNTENNESMEKRLRNKDGSVHTFPLILELR